MKRALSVVFVFVLCAASILSASTPLKSALVPLKSTTSGLLGPGSEPCGVANQILCQGQDGTGNLFASQNDVGNLGNFATAYDDFALTKAWDVESFHWVGGYFNPGPPGNITAWTLTFYNDNGGIPGNPIASGVFAGNGNETLLSNGLYMYSLFFGSFDMGPGTYWASVVPDQVFPPQWGWAIGIFNKEVGKAVVSWHKCYCE